MSATILVTFKETRWLHRFQCGICGAATEKQELLPWFNWEDLETDHLGGDVYVDRLDDAVTFESQEAGGDAYVCTECLEAGGEAAPQRLLQWAEDLEAEAREIRRLAECHFILPSVTELHAAQGDYDRRTYPEYFDENGRERPMPRDPGNLP